MHLFWTILFALIGIVWIVEGIRAGIGMNRLPRLANTPPVSGENAPMVSIVFAARDEAEKLPAAIHTLLAQQYPRFEVIAVNDRSSDATPSILHQMETTHANLKVIDIAKLPPGWLGKPHALVAGYEKSRGEWLLFTDADVHFAPDVLDRAMAMTQQHRFDHLTLLTSLEMHGFWEVVALTYFGLGFVIANEPWQTANPRSSRYSGVGAFQMVRREVYEASGGHRALRMDVIEDMKLGKLIKRAGFRSGMGIALGMVSVRWHAGLRNIIGGVTKNFFAACHYNVFMAVGALLSPIIMSVLPILGLVFGRGSVQMCAGFAAAAAMLTHALMIWSSEVSPLYGFTHPLGALLFCWMVARSTIVTLWRGGVTWRETFYPLDELRKGSV